MASEVGFRNENEYGVEEAVDLIGFVLSNLVKTASESLFPIPTRVVHVNPGRQVPWDDACPGGLLAGRVLTVTPFTGPGGKTAHACGVNEYVATVGISIVRCVAVIDDQGLPPSPEEMDQDGLQMTRDMANLMRVIQCNPWVRTMGAWNPLGNMGGVGGGEWTFQLRIPACQCPENLLNAV